MQEPKQNHKTKQYWDKFYSDVSSHAPQHSVSETDAKSFEWIVPHSSLLMDDLLSIICHSASDDYYRCYKMHLKVLEIGCGVSELSRCLLERLLGKRSKNTDESTSYEFVATDISEICIRQCQQRDNVFISSLTNSNDFLRYGTLDILTAMPSQLYDTILDKGTLDTFLFRTKRTKKGSEMYPPLLLSLLNNVHGWLNHGGLYIIISPRSRIKAVRDYNGFKSVTSVKFDVNPVGDVVLLKSNNIHSGRKNHVYIYKCKRNDDYDPERDAPFRITEKSTDDQSTCPKCQMSFRAFRGNVELKDQGVVVWSRRWSNHVVHCKGDMPVLE